MFYNIGELVRFIIENIEDFIDESVFLSEDVIRGIWTVTDDDGGDDVGCVPLNHTLEYKLWVPRSKVRRINPKPTQEDFMGCCSFNTPSNIPFNPDIPEDYYKLKPRARRKTASDVPIITFSSDYQEAKWRKIEAYVFSWMHMRYNE